MAKFKISKDESGQHTWKAEGINPKTQKQMLIRGGQTGTPVGKKNPDSEKTFDARHDATGMTPKKYINKLRWDNKAAFGTSIDIPDELFGKTAAKEASAKKKAASKKTTPKKSVPGKASAKKEAPKKQASKKTSAKKSSVKKTASKKKGV